jgi:hypothetical protein
VDVNNQSNQRKSSILKTPKSALKSSKPKLAAKRLDSKDSKDSNPDSDVSSHESFESDIMKQELKLDIISQVSDEQNRSVEFKGNAEVEVQGGEVPLPPFIMRHNSHFRMRWDLYVILLTLWNCLFIPFNVAFESEGLKTDENVTVKTFDYFIDMCFLIDMCLNFRTTFINSKT